MSTGILRESLQRPGCYLDFSESGAVVLLLLQRRRGRGHGRERDAVEVGDEGLPPPSEGSVQGLMEEEGVNGQIPSGALDGGGGVSLNLLVCNILKCKE